MILAKPIDFLRYDFKELHSLVLFEVYILNKEKLKFILISLD